MANNCLYGMHVKGLPENVREFYEILNYEKDIYNTVFLLAFEKNTVML